MDIHMPLMPHDQAHPLQACRIQQLANGPRCPATYTDGSYDGQQCAGAVSLSTGETLPDTTTRKHIVLPRGGLALALAAECAPVGDILRTDSMAAIQAVMGDKQRVTLGPLIQGIRDACTQKTLRLQHVRGHVGETWNEATDALARSANTTLSMPPKARVTQPWHILKDNALVGAPHKTWVRDLAPHHQHTGIHPVSWRVIKRPGWFVWLTGMRWAMGLQHPK